MGVQAKVTGLPDLEQALLSIAPKLRRRALRNALAAGARVVRDEARRSAPAIAIDSAPVRRGTRRVGMLRRAVSVRTSGIARRAGDVGVFVNVRPAKRGQRGAKSPSDPFYWRWQEFGRRGAAGKAFLQRGARRLGQALQIFIQKIGPEIQKLNGGKDVRL